MKYGDTLRQRSTPEWAHYNIDYDHLKDSIKHQTTSGTGKAVSIPGQGESSEKAFGGSFYRDLKAQHDRINLFIRSKSGEIERRLDYIHKNLKQLQSRRRPGDELSTHRIEQYAKIDADVNKAGEEIRSLSRFQVAQRTGIRKILKKYKRWTKDSELERQFREEVTSSPSSFYQLDLGYLLDQYIEVLGALRAPFDAAAASELPKGSKSSSPVLKLSQTCQDGCELDFDLAFSLTRLGSRGNKATYWIHSDHIVEAQVLLLQHMRLIAAPSRPGTRSSPEATPFTRRSSLASDKCLGNEDGVGLLVIDHPDVFAIKQNATSLGSGEETAGTLQVKAAGNARWTSSGKACVALDFEKPLEQSITASLGRSQLPYLFDSSASPNNLGSFSQSPNSASAATNASSGIAAARKWLDSHDGIEPIAGVASKRTRFIGVHNTSNGGIWATLDRDIFLKSDLHQDLRNDDWLSLARTGSVPFPHAVLEVRKEGAHSAALIQTLDRSHLMERIRGFSLQAQAVWACRKPIAMSAPTWVPLLDTDIRKLPPTPKRHRRKASTAASSQRSLPTTSGTSPGGHTTSTTPRQDDSPVTSAPEYVEEAPPLRAFRKKRRSSVSHHGAGITEPETQRYWNEYDNPESGDEGYYIYVDPDAPVTYPGQAFFEGFASKTRKLFGIKEEPEDGASISSAESSDDDTNDSPLGSSAGYGTFGSRSSRPRHEGYFNNLFRTIRDSRQDIEALNSMYRDNAHERRHLLREIECRQSKAENTKMHFYTTCLIMTIIIDILLGMMTITSRRRERGVVDAVVLFGTICNLLLGIISIISMHTRRDRLSWIHRGLVYTVFTANVVVDVFLFLWVFGEF